MSLTVCMQQLYITKLITGFGCSMEHDVGEEPNGEANCCSRKLAPFMGEGAIKVEVWKYMGHRREQIQFSEGCFSFVSSHSTFHMFHTVLQLIQQNEN